MRLLLDTNAFVWLTDAQRQHNLGKNARHLIDSATLLYVSPISIVELHMKIMARKLTLSIDVTQAIAETGLVLLDFKAEHAEAIANFPSLVHHDPFDRMLLAQADSERLTFLTSDTILLGLGLPFVIDARE